MFLGLFEMSVYRMSNKLILYVCVRVARSNTLTQNRIFCMLVTVKNVHVGVRCV